MHCFLFSDWVTLRGGFTPTAITQIVQGEEEWLNLDPYQDACAWLELRLVTNPTGGNSLFIDFQTSPVLDDVYFASLLNASGGLVLSTATPVQVVKLMRDATYTPLAKWLRWKVHTNGITPTQVWEVTMRIWMAVAYKKLPAGLCVPTRMTGGQART